MKAYRIEMLPPMNDIYVSSKREVQGWFSRNPGEGQGWEEVDVFAELDKFQDEIGDLEREVARLKYELENK